MTMVAKALLPNESGQSILEFLLLTPLMVAFVVVLVKVNTVIQSGIVNQQYARQHLHFMTFNSAWYPEVRFQLTNVIGHNAGMFAVAISDAPVDPEDPEFESTPPATIFSVARSPAAAAASGASDDPRTEDMDRRVRVRVRESAAICTQNLLMGGVPLLAMSTQKNGSDVVGTIANGARWTLNEGYRPDFCTPYQKVMDP